MTKTYTNKSNARRAARYESPNRGPRGHTVHGSDEPCFWTKFAGPCKSIRP
jgi:hypothetical protein